MIVDKLLSPCQSVGVHPLWFLKLLPSIAFCPFHLSPHLQLLKTHAPVTWHLEFLLPLGSCFFPQPFCDGVPQDLLLDVVCVHSLLPSPASYLCHALFVYPDGWMTTTSTMDPPPRSLSKLHACMSSDILESSTWMSQGHLQCSVARTGVLSSSGTPVLLCVFPLSLNDSTSLPVTQATDLWDILNAFLSFTFSNPSPSSLDVIYWVSFQSIHFCSHSLTPSRPSLFSFSFFFGWSSQWWQ